MLPQILLPTQEEVRRPLQLPAERTSPHSESPRSPFVTQEEEQEGHHRRRGHLRSHRRLPVEKGRAQSCHTRGQQ